jgi:hypothetical protein
MVKKVMAELTSNLVPAPCLRITGLTRLHHSQRGDEVEMRIARKSSRLTTTLVACTGMVHDDVDPSICLGCCNA